MNVFGFQANYLNLFLSLLSVGLSIIAGILRRKQRRISSDFDAQTEEKARLTAQHSALLKEHTQLGLTLRDVSEERTRCAAALKAASDSRDRISRELESATAAQGRLSNACRAVADGIAGYKNGPAVANAIRAAAKRKGVLQDVERLVVGVALTAPHD